MTRFHIRNLAIAATTLMLLACGGDDASSSPTSGDGDEGGSDAVTAPEDVIEVGQCCDGDDCELAAPDEFAFEDLDLHVSANGYTGKLNGITCAKVEVETEESCNLGQVADLDVGVAVTSNYVGDLVIKVRSPSGIVSTMMSRPGWDEAADDGAGTKMGSSASISSESELWFDDEASDDAEDMGFGKLEACSEPACDFVPNPGAAEGNGLSDFDGEPVAGEWWVCVGDSAGTNGATLDQVTLRFEME